jgi:hypothetical protein
VAFRSDLYRGPEKQTRGAAVTVAGQWRIFTVFPNIQLRFLMKVTRAVRQRLRAETIRFESSEAYFVGYRKYIPKLFDGMNRVDPATD